MGSLRDFSNDALNGAISRQISCDAFRLTESAHRSRAHYSAHQHPYPMLVFILSGTIVEHIDRRTIDYRPWTVLFKPAGEIHEDRFGVPGGRSFSVEGDPNQLAEISARWPGHTRTLTGVPCSRAMSLLRAFRQGDDFLAIHAEEFWFETARADRLDRVPDDQSITARRVRQAGQLIREDVSRPLYVRAIAREVDVHPVYLARLFRRLFGISIAGYISRVRVEQAIPRLLRREETISEIALALGFSDQSHFTNVFRRETGSSPARFLRDFDKVFDASTARSSLVSRRSTRTEN